MEHINHKVSLFSGLVMLSALLVGCATYNSRLHAHKLALATQDDAACQAQGWKYPSPRYVSCRMQLQDERTHRDWLNLQLMHQTQAQPTGIPQAYPYRETYKPLNRANYSCWMSNENGHVYILCDEKGNGGKNQH